jgi:hypothetical protein
MYSSLLQTKDANEDKLLRLIEKVKEERAKKNDEQASKGGAVSFES